MLLRLDALCACDRCHGEFAVSIDDLDCLAPHDLTRVSLRALLEDALRTRQTVAGGFPSLRAGRMLCVGCTIGAADPVAELVAA